MQEKSQLPNVPPLSGPALVAGINEIARTLGTNFAGADDPAALAWPYATWADTGNGLLKRRNAAGTDWVVEAELFERAARRNGDLSQDFSAKNLLVGDGSAGAVAVIRNGVTEAIRIKDTGEVEIQNLNNPTLAGKLDTANAFGVGQSWQNVTASRSFGVTYSNTTGRPIFLSVILKNVYGGATTSALEVNGFTLSNNTRALADEPDTHFALIPNGSNYSIPPIGNTAVVAWWELR